MVRLLDKCIALYKCNDNLATVDVIDAMDNWPMKADANTQGFSSLSGNPPHLTRCLCIDDEDEEVISSGLLSKYRYFKDEDVGSINAWVYPRDNAPSTIFAVVGDDAGDGGYFIMQMIETFLRILVHNGSSVILDVTSAVGSVPLDTWSMLSFAVDSTGNKLYRNGQELTGLTYNVGTSATRAFLGDVPTETLTTIGSEGILDGESETYQYFLKGRVDALSIYNEKLTQEEFLFLYNNGNGREDLTGYLHKRVERGILRGVGRGC